MILRRTPTQCKKTALLCARINKINKRGKWRVKERKSRRGIIHINSAQKPHRPLPQWLHGIMRQHKLHFSLFLTHCCAPSLSRSHQQLLSSAYVRVDCIKSLNCSALKSTKFSAQSQNLMVIYSALAKGEMQIPSSGHQRVREIKFIQLSNLLTLLNLNSQLIMNSIFFL